MNYTETETIQGTYLSLGEKIVIRDNAVEILYTTTTTGATVISDDTANALENAIGGFNAPWAITADNYAEWLSIYNAKNYLIHYYTTYGNINHDESDLDTARTISDYNYEVHAIIAEFTRTTCNAILAGRGY